MKHNSPKGPQPTGVAIFGQFQSCGLSYLGSRFWVWISLGSGSWAWIFSLGGPCSLPLSSSLIAVNISTKWKRQKKKRKKISSLEATRSLWPSQPRLPPEQSAASGPWQPGLLCICVHPQPGGRAARAAFYSPETKKSRSNSETKNPFPSWHPFLSSPSLLHLPLASVSLPGVCTSLPAPGLGACLPLSSPLAWGRHPSHPKMLLPRWLRCPFEFLPLVFCFWNSAGDEKLISFLERFMGEGR